MTKIQVPASKVLDTLRSVATESADYVYAAPEHMAEGRVMTCFYVHEDENGENKTPGCLVGKVLNVLGVPLDELSQYEGNGAWTASDGTLEMTGHPDDMMRARNALMDAQCYQDEGSPWGEALAKALREPGE